MNADIRKANKRYIKAVQKLEAAAVARLDQEAIVRSEQAELAHRADAVRRAANEAENRRDDIIRLVGRAS